MSQLVSFRKKVHGGMGYTRNYRLNGSTVEQGYGESMTGPMTYNGSSSSEIYKKEM